MQFLINKAHRLGDSIRYRMATMAILIGGAIIMAAAIGFAIASGFIWLSMQMPSYLAALVVAGVLCLLSTIMIVLASMRKGSEKTPSSLNAPTNFSEAGPASEHIVREALEVTMDTPIKAIFAATAIGLIVGLLRTKNNNG